MNEAEAKKIKSSKDLPFEIFQRILYKGFYYKTPKGIYWESNAVFIGNGYYDHMVKTYPLGCPEFPKGGGFAIKDQHYWDWGQRSDVFSFEDYGVTWSAFEEDLKK